MITTFFDAARCLLHSAGTSKAKVVSFWRPVRIGIIYLRPTAYATATCVKSNQIMEVRSVNSMLQPGDLLCDGEESIKPLHRRILSCSLTWLANLVCGTTIPEPAWRRQMDHPPSACVIRDWLRPVVSRSGKLVLSELHSTRVLRPNRPERGSALNPFLLANTCHLLLPGGQPSWLRSLLSRPREVTANQRV